MSKKIFINLPVQDPGRSMDFYTAIGFNINPQFSDGEGKCMVWSEHIYLMLLNHAKFSSFATKPIADTKNHLAALLSLMVESKEEIDHIVEAGLKAGGKEPTERKDYGFMQQRTIEDADGHTWEIFCMEMK